MLRVDDGEIFRDFESPNLLFILVHVNALSREVKEWPIYPYLSELKVGKGWALGDVKVIVLDLGERSKRKTRGGTAPAVEFQNCSRPRVRF